MERIARGALAGVLATLPMTVVMMLGKALGLMAVPPPVQITANVEEKAAASDALPRETSGVRWLALHFGYGGLLGALFAVARPALPRRTATVGLLYGLLLWLGNYAGLMPALGLYPKPTRDRPSRLVVMVIADLVFGSALGAADRLLNWRPGLLLARTRLGEIRERL